MTRPTSFSGHPSLSAGALPGRLTLPPIHAARNVSPPTLISSPAAGAGDGGILEDGSILHPHRVSIEETADSGKVAIVKLSATKIHVTSGKQRPAFPLPPHAFRLTQPTTGVATADVTVAGALTPGAATLLEDKTASTEGHIPPPYAAGLHTPVFTDSAVVLAIKKMQHSAISARSDTASHAELAANIKHCRELLNIKRAAAEPPLYTMMICSEDVKKILLPQITAWLDKAQIEHSRRDSLCVSEYIAICKHVLDTIGHEAFNPVGSHFLVSVDSKNAIQAISQATPGRFESTIYKAGEKKEYVGPRALQIDFVLGSPSNLRIPGRTPQYRGAATSLIEACIFLSYSLGFKGAVQIPVPYYLYEPLQVLGPCTSHMGSFYVRFYMSIFDINIISLYMQNLLPDAYDKHRYTNVIYGDTQIQNFLIKRGGRASLSDGFYIPPVQEVSTCRCWM